MNQLFSWIGKRLGGGRQDSLEYLCHGAQHLKDLYDYASVAPIPLRRDTGPELSAKVKGGADQNHPDRIHPLDFNTLFLTELILGKDLKSVRIHTGPDADRRTRAAGAEALASDREIYIRGGVDEGETAEGRARLIHELIHTVQTGEGAKTDFGEDRVRLEKEAGSREAMLNRSGWHHMERESLGGDHSGESAPRENSGEKLIRIVGKAGQEYLLTEEELEEVKEEAKEKLTDWLNSEWRYFDEEKKFKIITILSGRS